MSLSHFHFFSQTLGKQVAANVILPDTGTGPFATFYLLHGLSDDYSMWLRRTNIERYVGNLPLAIVMPDGFRGAYTNNEQGPAYATYITQDLVGAIERSFRVRTDRDGRCIGGLSMGGYGALRLGLGFPEMFASVNSHSGAVRWGSRAPGTGRDKGVGEFERVFGPNPAGSDHDLLELAARCKSANNLPKIRIDCGVDDFLIEDNREFTADLTEMNVDHEYEEFPGAHDWNYWDQHVRDALAFHARNLNLVAPTP